MKATPLGLKDSFLITPRVYEDQRGFFYEFFNEKTFQEQTGLQVHFIQDNLAKSQKGSLRGFHFQKGKFAQAKLVSVIQGAALDVIVDIRNNSKTFGQHYSVVLDNRNKKQLFVPRGFAHAYLSLEDDTLFYYKVDNYYNKESEGGISYADPEINMDWNFDMSQIILSEKDKKLPLLKEISDLL